MSTILHQVAGKCNSSAVWQFTGGNAIGRETMFFSCNVASVVAGVWSLFPRVRCSIWESCRQKVHRIVARARFALQNVKETDGFGALLEDKVGKK